MADDVPRKIPGGHRRGAGVGHAVGERSAKKAPRGLAWPLPRAMAPSSRSLKPATMTPNDGPREVARADQYRGSPLTRRTRRPSTRRRGHRDGAGPRRPDRGPVRRRAASVGQRWKTPLDLVGRSSATARSPAASTFQGTPCLWQLRPPALHRPRDCGDGPGSSGLPLLWWSGAGRSYNRRTAREPGGSG